MQIYYGVCTALLGLIFGSFLNCTAMRLVRKEDFVKGRSHCMSCGHELSAVDLIPLFSWLIHKGRCRYCGNKVSIRYPLTEFTFMVLSVGLYIGIIILEVGVGTAGTVVIPAMAIEVNLAALICFFKYWFLVGCLFVLSLVDLEIMEIPDGCLVLGLIGWLVGTVLEVVFRIHDIKWALLHLLAGFLTGALMLVLSIVMDRVFGRDSLGGGDIKLFALLAVYLGFAGAYELIILSCILGLIFVYIRKKLFPNASKEFPFGPSIAVGGYILLLTGEFITSWYIGLL